MTAEIIIGELNKKTISEVTSEQVLAWEKKIEEQLSQKPMLESLKEIKALEW